MNQAASPAPRPLLRRILRLAGFLAALLLLLALLIGWLLQPQRAGGLLLRKLGDGLGLEITAATIDYRLRGTPQLVLREVVAQRSGDVPLLKARRAFLSLPWSTIRARGSDLTVQRIELDAPVLDLPALQRWQSTRPPGEPRIPTLLGGARIVDGRVTNDDWTVDRLAIDLPELQPDRMLRARVRGRYLDPPISIPADLAIAVANPRHLLAGAPTGVAGAGAASVVASDWQVPATVFLAGPLRLGRDSALMKPARLGIDARYRSASTELPFRLGVHGPMAFNNATWRFVPAQLVLDGDGAVPDAGARGSVSIGRQLRLHLDGSIAAWPEAWPALPRPLSQATAPMPFALDYRGGIDFADLAELELRRDEARFAARFHLPDVLAWLKARDTGSPLPPLDGTLSAPRIDIAGARLHGVEIEMEEPGVAEPAR